MSRKPLRVLTWHVHGNYLNYLSQAPHDFYIVTKPQHPPGYAGRVGHLPWGDNVYEVPVECVRDTEFDCVLYQHHNHYAHDRLRLLSDAQRALPALFVQHDPPREHPTDTLHPVQDPNVLLVHVTPFNALMWDSGVTPTRVIVFDSSVRSNFTCNPAGISAISSRNSVPPRAASNMPTCCATAPVKLPFSCPNKWDSAMSFGIAPQLTGTNGPRRRGLMSWMSRAIPPAADSESLASGRTIACRHRRIST